MATGVTGMNGNAFAGVWDWIAMPATSWDVDETALVAQFFGGAKGTFVEVGALDPVVESQTFHLEQAGWSGVLIEPQSDHAARLRAHRAARVFEVACGAPDQHGTTMPMWIAGMSTTMQPSWVTADRGRPPMEVRQIPVRTLDSILAEAGVAAVDFLSIDVEGFEFNVLQGLSLDRWRPALILLEDHGTDMKAHRRLVADRYKRVRRTGFNSWYVPVETPFPISLFGRWQLFRKYYLSMPFRWIRDWLRAHRRVRPARGGGRVPA